MQIVVTASEFYECILLLVCGIYNSMNSQDAASCATFGRRLGGNIYAALATVYRTPHYFVTPQKHGAVRITDYE